MNNGAPIDPTNPATMPNAAPKKNSTGKIVLIIILVGFFLLALPLTIVALVFGGIFSIFKSVESELEKGNKLVCTTSDSSLTVYYDDYRITGVMNRGSDFGYDTDEIEDILDGYSTTSIESNLVSFGKEIVGSSHGATTCTLNGLDVSTLSAKDFDNSVLKVVGNDKIGYVDLPSAWDIIQTTSADSAYGSYVNSSTGVSLGINISYLANVASSDSEDLTIRLQSLEAYAKEYTQTLGDLTDSKDRISANYETVTIGKNQDISAVKATIYKDNTLTQVSYFFENGNNTHIVTFSVVGGGDKALDYINPIMDTFRFEKI